MKPEIVSSITSSITALCAVGGLITAMRGLKTWRHELRGRSEYELARRIMILVYKIRGGLEYVQQPFMSESEWRNRPGRDASKENREEDVRYAYSMRLQSVGESRQVLDVELLEAEAIWGDVLKPAEKKLTEVYAKLATVVMSYLDSCFTEREQYSPEEQKLLWKKLFSVNEEGEKFRSELTDAVQAFESVLRQHLRRS